MQPVLSMQPALSMLPVLALLSVLIGGLSLRGSAIGRVGRVDGIGFQEGVALPVLGQENAAKIRMPLEEDAEHVVALPLHPVRSAPDGDE